MNEQVMSIPPDQILADDNARYGLVETRVQSLMDAIARDGQVNDPVEVNLLDSPSNGHKYRLVVGHYRHAAATRLNKEQNAGIELPAIIRPAGDDKQRLIRQVSENNDRQNFTPMDSAIAIQKMLDAGIPRLDIRKAFSRPNVKGKLEPASNSFLNMMTSFLDFPKPIQKRLQDGTLGVASAYLLRKCSKEKWEGILADADREREKYFANEEKDEAKFLEAEKKMAEAKQKEEELKAEREKAAKALEDANLAVKEKLNDSIAAYEAAKMEKNDEKRLKLEEELKAKEKAAQEAEKAAGQARKTLDGTEKKLKSLAELAEESKKRLEAKRNEADKASKGKPDKGPGREEVAKAAKKQGENPTGLKALNARDMREVLDDLITPANTTPKVKEIAAAFKQCFDSQLTTKMLYVTLQKIVGEYVEPVKKSKK